MIEIDGSFGEGGGQILRTSLALSALTDQPIHLQHIRANRSQPGLRPQHLTAVLAAAKITRATLQGASKGSREITFEPSGLFPGKFNFVIPTAGAVSLVLQTISLPLSFAGSRSKVTLTGGTHVRWSPIFHYILEQWLPWMHQRNFRAHLELQHAGFYPRGGGSVTANILPCNDLQPFTCLDRGALVRIRGLSGVANLEKSIAKRQKHQALKRLYEVCPDSKIQEINLPAPGKGTFILLRAEFEHCGTACYTALGAPGKPAERVADEAVNKLLTFLATDATVDHYLADQILLPLAVIKGASSFRTNKVTQHLLTNAFVIKRFLPVKIDIEGELDQPGLVRVTGQSLNVPVG